MSSDRPDSADEPRDRRDGGGGERQAAHAASARPEPRSRPEYYADLRIAVSAEETATAQRTLARERASEEKWQEKSAESRWIWEEYQRKWPASERARADGSDDRNSWTSDHGRSLDEASANRVEIECGRIAARERDKISPALQSIEDLDPGRKLIGFEHRLKGRDRIKEKVCDSMREFDFSPEEAVSIVADTIRFTFQYRESLYTRGVLSDIDRLKEHGFELHKLKNSWTDDQYRGINSQWIDPDSGQRFEVQFHTRISFEAKQLTHDAYERIRTSQGDKLEQLVLEAFQRKVVGEVPVPDRAQDIHEYP